MDPRDERAVAGLDDIMEQDTNAAPATRPSSPVFSSIKTPAPTHTHSHGQQHHSHHRHSLESTASYPAPAPPSPELTAAGKPHPHPDAQHSLVTFAADEAGDPKNWSKGYKWYCTMVVALTCFVVAFNSSVITADVAGVAEEFHVSEEVALLSITLFVVGFGVGPMVFAPLSEVYGRRII